MTALELRELTRSIRKEKGDNTLSPVIGGVVVLVCNNEDNHCKKSGFWKMNPENYNEVEEVHLPPFGKEDITWIKISEDDFFGKAVYAFTMIGAVLAPYTCPEDDM